MALLKKQAGDIPAVDIESVVGKTYSVLPRGAITIAQFYALLAETAQGMILASANYAELAGAIEHIGLTFETLGFGASATSHPIVVEGLPPSMLMMNVSAGESSEAPVETIPVTLPETRTKFSEVVVRVNSIALRGKPSPRYHPKLEEFVLEPENSARIDALISGASDAPLPFFDAMRVMRRTYLVCDPSGRILELPIHMFMRVALGLHIMARNPSPIPLPDMETADDGPWGIVAPDASLWGRVGDAQFWDDVELTFNTLVNRRGLHATPTLINGGTIFPMYASCYLGVVEDSLKSITNTVDRLAIDSKFGSGNGISVGRLRLKGSYIRSTSGFSNGPWPWLKMFADTLEGVDQGGGKRKGAGTLFLPGWHGFIFALIQFRSNKESNDNMYRLSLPTTSLFLSDLFMERVETEGNWTLFDPACFDKDAHLSDLWGDEFKVAYERYEREGRGVMTFPAAMLYNEICVQQKETGCPYIAWKDAINRSSNQIHQGVTESLNLCMEIRQRATADQWQMCNLANINLAAFVEGTAWDGDGPPDGSQLYRFDHEGFMKTGRQFVRNINAAIDGGVYVMKGAAEANLKDRPMGIGMQGWGDALARMAVDPESEEANLFARRTTAELYYACLSESIALAAVHGVAPGYPGCPLSEGKLHPDLWEGEENAAEHLAPHLDWAKLRADLAEHGARNLFFVALMPSASTSVVCNNSFSEMVDPFKSLFVVRKYLAGEFGSVPPIFEKALNSCGLDMDAAVEVLLANRGSIQSWKGVPDILTTTFKTVYDIRPSKMVSQAHYRQGFVDQAISMNIHMKVCTVARLKKLHMDTWKKRLMTGMYYLRTQPTANSASVTARRVKTVAKDESPAEPDASEAVGAFCTRDDPDCLACQ